MWREFESLADQPFFTGTWEGNGTSAQNFYWSTWVNTLGGTGINANPLFVDDIGNIHGEDQANISGELQAGSPAINQGEDIQAIIEGMGLPWTDINGNARDNTPDLGAYQYVPQGPDLTPPDVTGATLLDSITLKITFSEPLDPSTAQNPNNYSINNGITVVSALLTGSVVTLTTSPHSYGTYTVTVSNVEDITGNIVSPISNSADYDWIQDVTPPDVTGAALLDSITLKIMFSEMLDETTAEDENNYSISNNIDIFNASLSGSEVTLQTSTHSPGSYIVTVVNVEDIAGNPIAQSNTAEYSFIPPIPSDTLIMFLVEDVYGVIQEPGHTPLKTIDGLGALDGDPDSRWAAEPMPEELIFDLGTNRTVLKTKLSFYNWNEGRVYSYSILISSDNNNWVTIVSQATSASNEEWTIDEFPAVDARYVKVDFINNNQSDWAGLWEGEIWGISSTVVDPINSELPDEFSLYQNYPNPFNPSTTIEYSVSEASLVKLVIYNAIGQEVAVLVDEEKQAGSYKTIFNAADLTSGIYFYKLKSEKFVETKKMIFLK